MHLNALALAVTTLLLLNLVPGGSDGNEPESWKKDVLEWRAKHTEELRKPDGWLALAGLEWLEAGETTFGGGANNKIRLPGAKADHLGVLELKDLAVTLKEPAGGFPKDFLVDGAPAKAQTLRTDVDNDKNAVHMTIGTLNLYVIRRADRFALRIKDSKSEALRGFHELKWYEPDARYRVEAKWMPYNPPKVVTLVTLAGTDDPQPMPGVAEFQAFGSYLPAGAGDGSESARQIIFYFARHHEHFHDVRSVPVSVHCPAEPWRDAGRRTDAGFQSPGKSAVRVYPVLDMPASAAGESPAHRAAGRRAALSRIGWNGTMTLEGGADAIDRGKLTELRTVLLRLHKTLLDMERREYEREHGHVSTGELFRLVIDHQQFGWLHNISEFVVRLDETLAGRSAHYRGRFAQRGGHGAENVCAFGIGRRVSEALLRRDPARPGGGDGARGAGAAVQQRTGGSRRGVNFSRSTLVGSE